jgi:hypothetical protein
MSATEVHIPCDGCGDRCRFAKSLWLATEAERQGLRLEHRRKSPKGAFMWDLAVIGGGPLAVKSASLDFVDDYLKRGRVR